MRHVTYAVREVFAISLLIIAVMIITVGAGIGLLIILAGSVIAGAAIFTAKGLRNTAHWLLVRPEIAESGTQEKD